ncbi:MAG: ribonuclease H-like domain-containing protein [Candidatus Magasanikbacteria bacterium]|nr:ribonuclease H-like domain-containing protein [Candidatus Magasanikbacteria bacterium]
MSALVFDIETIGEDYNLLDETTQTMLTRWLKRESYDDDEYEHALDDVKNGLGFSPLTGQIVAIGILDVERGKGAVYYQAPGEKHDEFEEEGIVFKQKTEAEMLASFWQVAEKFTTFVSFNGRQFDAPYLAVRSAAHHIKPSKNLLSNRYLSMQRGAEHVDLIDQLSFYGAMRRRGSLHLWSRAFGIKSPKADGVSGDDVAGLFKEKKFVDIAKYNVGDLRATCELFEVWKKYFVV